MLMPVSRSRSSAIRRPKRVHICLVLWASTPTNDGERSVAVHVVHDETDVVHGIARREKHFRVVAELSERQPASTRVLERHKECLGHCTSGYSL